MKILSSCAYNNLNQLLGISKINGREVFINILDEYCDIEDEPFSGLGLKYLYDNYDQIIEYYEITKPLILTMGKDSAFISIEDFYFDKKVDMSLRIFYTKIKLVSNKETFRKGELYKLQLDFITFNILYDEFIRDREAKRYEQLEEKLKKREYYD